MCKVDYGPSCSNKRKICVCHDPCATSSSLLLPAWLLYVFKDRSPQFVHQFSLMIQFPLPLYLSPSSASMTSHKPSGFMMGSAKVLPLGPSWCLLHPAGFNQRCVLTRAAFDYQMFFLEETGWMPYHPL